MMFELLPASIRSLLLLGLYPFLALLGADFFVPTGGSLWAQGIVINEVMASNATIVADEDGDFEDWIELMNTSGELINLAGWGLSDDYARPFRWVFPSVEIGPGQFMVVWASGKNRLDPSAPLHTNYSISAAGEEILLTRPDGLRVDDLPPTLIPDDVSIGRRQGAGDAWFYFEQPTPGVANNTPGFDEILAEPEFSQAGGFFTEPVALTLNAAPGVTILYTLDGSEPDQANIGGRNYSYKNSYPGGGLLTRTVETFVYEGPIEIANRSGHSNPITGINTRFLQSPHSPPGHVFSGTPVRVRGVRDGALSSGIRTQIFFVHPLADSLYDQILVLSIVTDERNLFDYERGIYVPGQLADDWWAENGPNFDGWSLANYNLRGIEGERPAHLEMFEPGGERILNQGIGIRGHGGWSRYFAWRKSLRLYAKNAYDNANAFNYPIFPGLTAKGGEGQPVESFRRLVLRNAGNDWDGTLLRDAVQQSLVADLPIDSLAQSRPVAHFINGEFWGLMNLRERMDHHYLESHYGLVPDDAVILFVVPELNIPYQSPEPDYSLLPFPNLQIDRGTMADRDDYLTLHDFAVAEDLSDDAAFAQIEAWMDVENFATYYAIQIYLGNQDWPQNNQDFWRKRLDAFDPSAPTGHDGRWRWMLYDLDFGFDAGAVERNTLARIVENRNVGGFAPVPWANRLFQNLLANGDFRHLFLNRLADMTTVFHPDRVNQRVDEFNARIEPYRDEHWRRWGSGTNRGGFMKTFAAQRPGHVRSHAQEVFNLPGTAEVTIVGSDSPRGRVQVNSILLDTDTPGTTTQVGVGRPLLEEGSVWRFLDDGSDQGQVWREPSFSDLAWREGPAGFGYGSPSLYVTEVDFGEDPEEKPITSYFRKSFVWDYEQEPEFLNLFLRARDGAVVYLNEVEVARENMPSGNIDYRTPATGKTNFAESSDLAVWFAADREMVVRASASGPAVVQWTDLSGNERHAVQGTNTLQPRVVADAIQGLPAVRFNGSSRFLQAPIEDYRDGMTLFMVARVHQDGGGFDSYFGLNGAGLGNVLYHVGSGGGRGLGITQPNQNLSNTPISSNQFELIRVDADSNYNHRMTRVGSGESVGAQLTQTGGVVDNLTLGASKNGGENITDHLSLDIAEVIVFSRELSREETEEVELYLGNKYNMDWRAIVTPESANPLLWLAADGPLESRTDSLGQMVEQWRDLSGNERHAVQTNETRQPQWIANVINGKPVVRFNGQGTFLEAPIADTREGMTLFLVTRVEEDGDPFDSYAALDGAFGGNVSYHVGREGGRGLGITQPTSDLVNRAGGSDRFELIRIEAKEGFTHRMTRVGSGESVSVRLPETGGSVTELTLGAARSSIGRIGNFLSFDLAEVVLYDRELSEEEARGIEVYLAEKYDLELPPQWVNYPLQPSALVKGKNVLAVEVHLSSPSAETLLFDARIEGNLPGEIPVWTGVYFRDVPVRVEAIPEFGYRFAGWQGRDETDAVLDYMLTADVVLTPLFEVDEAALQELKPPPHDLSAGPYVFPGWDPASAAGTYPDHMVFEQTSPADPGLLAEMDGFWELPYDLTSRSRINGLGADGVGFINTGNVQALPGAGYLGSALLALDTRGQSHIQVSWTGGTILPNSRSYGLRLQYRVGDSGGFSDLLDENGEVVEYVRHEVAGHSETMGPVLLPEELEDQPYVQLRWKYYFIEGESGPRAQLRLGDVRVTSGQPGIAVRFVFEKPLFASMQSGKKLPPVSVRVLDQAGRVAADYEGMIELDLVGNGQLVGSRVRSAEGGIAVFDDLEIRGAGEVFLRASATGLESGETSLFRVVRMTEQVLPRFMQGEQDANGDNRNRLPFAFRLLLEGLKPGGIYRYGNRIIVEEDSAQQNGAGNAVYVTGLTGDWIRNTNAPRFGALDFGDRHHQFTADEEGRFGGWFVTEPTGNARFTPGNQVRVRLLLNDGEGGEEVHHILSGSSPVKVLRLGSEADEATGLIGESRTGPKQLVLLFDNEEGTGRPVAAVPVEQTGATVDDRYAGFYQERVAPVPGRWGTLIPNALSAGIRRIEEWSLEDEGLRSILTFPAGIMTTVNAQGGLDPMVIGRAESYAAWVERVLSDLEDWEDPAVSGPLADPLGEGVPNLLRHALGSGWGEISRGLFPYAEMEEDRWVFVFRRDPSNVDIAYIVEASSDLTQWSEVLYDSRINRGENTDGSFMRVPDLLAVGETGGGGRRFLRLRVEKVGPLLEVNATPGSNVWKAVD